MVMGGTAKRWIKGAQRAVGQSKRRRALRQAAAVGRLELLKLASMRLRASVDRLKVTDGIVQMIGESAKKIW